MKKIVLLLLASWSFVCVAQYEPYCLYDFAGWYRLSTINTSTGNITQIAPIPIVQFYVLGNKQCINTHDSTYTFAGHDGSDVRLYTVTMDSASIVSDPIFNNNVVGLQYNCNDSSIYALEENGGAYDLVKVNRTTGVTSQIGSVSGVTAYVGDAFVLDVNRGLYHFFGLFGGNIKLYSIDITTGMVTASPFFPDNLTGLAYNCQDSTVYGLWEDGTDYKLESINPITGTHNTVGILAGIDPGFVAESASINYYGEYVYRGFAGPNNLLVTIDVQTASVIDTVSFSSNVSGIDYYVCCNEEPIISNISEYSVKEKLSIRPNPLNSQATITWEENMQNGFVEVYDVSGKLVFQKSGISGNQYIFQKGNLKKGLYFINVFDNNNLKEYFEKVIIN